MNKIDPSLYLIVHAVVAFLCGAITGLPIVYVAGFLFLAGAFFAHRLLNEEGQDGQHTPVGRRVPATPQSQTEQSEQRVDGKAVVDVSADKEAELAEQVERLQQTVDGLTREVERLRKLEPSGSTRSEADGSAPAPTQNQDMPSKSTAEQMSSGQTMSTQVESGQVVPSKVEVARAGGLAKAAPAVGKKEAKTNAQKGTLGSLWWRLESGLLRIGGQGEMPSYEHPWEGKEVTEVVIEQGVLSVGSNAFRGCAGLTQVALPIGLEMIGWGAFENCTSLTHVTLPQGLKEIGWEAFKDCTGLTHVTFPKGLKEIGYGAFRGCTSLSSLTLPQGLTSIARLAFDETPLRELKIPDSVTDVKGPLFSKEPTFPVLLPKGREDLPVTPRLEEENCLRRLADSFFGNRRDVLLEPTGDPDGDRYTAVRQLLRFVKEYLNREPHYLERSRVRDAELFFCCDVDYETTSSGCYDGGGDGPVTVDKEKGVYISILAEGDFRQRAAKWDSIQEEPFPIWRDGTCQVALLERPFGLYDYYKIYPAYPIHLPDAP